MGQYVYHSIEALFKFMGYLGIGFICHAFLNSPTLDWSSAWTFAWVLGWPLMLIIKLGYYFLWFLGGALLLGVVWFFAMWIKDEIARRKRVAAWKKRQNGN